MRKIAKGQDQEGAEIDLTPMLDVVFIMLIFFIVTTSFVKETGVDINRPNAETAERDEKGNILYIGKAKVLSNMVKNYLSLNNLTRRIQRMVSLTLSLIHI